MHTKVIQNHIKHSRILTITGLTSTLLLSLLILTIYQPLYYHGKNEQKVIATTGSSIQATTSLSITTASNVAGVDLLVKDNNGTFASSDDSGNTLGFNVTTNNYTGYTLTIASPDTTTYNNGKLTNTDTTNCTDATKCVLNTISEASSTISTNGTWGYKPSKLNSAANTNYLPSPTTTATTLDKTTTANTTDTYNTYTIGLAAKADYTQPAGVYSNTYILQATGNPVNYSISYNKGTTDTVSNMPASSTSGSTSNTSVKLSTTVPTRTGYTFKSWCLGTVSNNGTTCTKDASLPDGADYEFDAGASFGIDQTTTNITTLYATWTINKYNLVITADSNVSSMSVKAGSTSGTETTCTKSTSSSNNIFTCPSLTYGTSYYLYPVFISGYKFSGWTKTDSAINSSLGSTTTENTYYTIGAGDGALTLVSENDVYIITYNANGGSGSIESQTGSSITLADNAYTRPNYYFKGWATSASGSVAYRANQTITPTSNMTLYAVWGSSSSTSLYNIVKSLTKGNQTNDADDATGIRAAITKANSGVYTYDASAFGTASDSSNSNPIYYYRGILDKATDSYGSAGDAMSYPNYVKMTTGSNTTCWRIVRTTGSGGVKLIYNGIYGATTSGSCANTGANTRIANAAFNANSNISDHSIISVGYTFNSNYKTTTTATAAGTLFGTDSNYTGNNTRSTIKTYIEDTWYASSMTSWTSKLEASAGYCNDRSIYNSSGSKLSDTDTVTGPYEGTKVYNFGATQRSAPSLTCPYATRDLYRYVSGSSGIYNQLKYPAALLTADEAIFAGSRNKYGYLSSNINFWLLSPGNRGQFSTSYTFMFYMGGDGGASYGNWLSLTLGVRPVISLKSGITPTSGSGTATDPWVVQ